MLLPIIYIFYSNSRSYVGSSRVLDVMDVSTQEALNMSMKGVQFKEKWGHVMNGTQSVCSLSAYRLAVLSCENISAKLLTILAILFP